jgi:hypothetical protein
MNFTATATTPPAASNGRIPGSGIVGGCAHNVVGRINKSTVISFSVFIVLPLIFDRWIRLVESRMPLFFGKTPDGKAFVTRFNAISMPNNHFNNLQYTSLGCVKNPDGFPDLSQQAT